MKRLVGVDLHVHTALSPCGSEQMRPPAVLLSAERRGIGVVGIVDHNSARNAGAFLAASEAFAVRVFVGLEVESAEGVHLLALFDSTESALELDAAVAAHLPPLANRPDLFGEQWLVDEYGEVTGCDGRLLVTATDLSIDEIARMTQELSGFSLPAHIDRSANGLLPVLGFVPPDLPVDLYEVSRHLPRSEARERWPQLRGLPLVASSDAHYLEDIGQGAILVPEEFADLGARAGAWAQALGQYLLEHEDA